MYELCAYGSIPMYCHLIMRMVVSGTGHDIEKYRFLKVNMMFVQSIFLAQFFPTILSC